MKSNSYTLESSWQHLAARNLLHGVLLSWIYFCGFDLMMIGFLLTYVAQ